MMGVPGQSLKDAKRRKRAAKKRKRELAQSTQPQGTLNDMEEIHLKRRVLDPSSELLLTWWDETKNQQEGLLISCKCNNNCAGTSSTSNPAMGSASNNGDEGSILLREKLNIRSPPYVSNMMDTSYSGVALYNEANGLSTSGLTTGSTPTRTVNGVPMNVTDVPMVATRRTDKWQTKRPFPCDYCVKSFRTLYEKRRHESIHTGYRPWKCTECNKAFVARASLRNHMKKRHPGYKPFECSFCDINFFNTASRTKHEQTHRRMKAEKMEMMMRREMAASGIKLAAPSVTIDQVGEQLRQQLVDTSVELLEVGNGVEGEDPMLVKQEPNDHSPTENDGVNSETNHQASDQADADMANVFNITVIPDTVTVAEADAK